MKRKAVYAREFKKYGIRYSHKPQEHELLAGTVQVSGLHGRGFCYIKFSEELVTAIGKAMPLGVSPDQPCYLKAVHSRRAEVWKVYAFYLGSSIGVLLWETSDKPDWMKRIRSSDDRQSKKTATTTT